jgi:hypothetical protein
VQLEPEAGQEPPTYALSLKYVWKFGFPLLISVFPLITVQLVPEIKLAQKDPPFFAGANAKALLTIAMTATADNTLFIKICFEKDLIVPTLL